MITRLHVGLMILIAVGLHVGIAIWLALAIVTPVSEKPRPKIHISLLATVAETTVNPPPVIKEPPPPEPVSESVPPPEPLPPVQSKKKHREPEQKPPPPPQEIVQPPLPEVDSVPQDAIATAQYEQLLVAWLEKHKRYPIRAKRLRIEGEGRLRILIDHTGRTQRVKLEQTTGNRLLDKAALEMARRANPFPPIPEKYSRKQLEFVVPVVFALR